MTEPLLRTRMFGVILVIFLGTCISSSKGVYQWPNGRYCLPQSIHGCPDNITWSTGTLSQPLNDKSNISKPTHLAAKVSSKGVQRSFCTKETTDPRSLGPQWPTGKYCIYRKGNSCPVGLKSGSIMWDDRLDVSGFGNYSKGVLPKGNYKYNSLIFFCCSVNGDKNHPVALPLEKPFYLLAYESQDCQAVEGALSRAEYIYYDTDNYNVVKDAHPYSASQSSIKIIYCYYQACWSNFTSLSGTIMSPFYPSDYPQSTNCRWTIQVPQDYHISLRLDVIDLEPSISCNKDWVRITGESSTKYCSQPVNHDINTKSNVVVVEFHSDQVATSHRGFVLNYTAVYKPVSTTTGPQTTDSISPNVTATSSNQNPTTTTTTTEYKTNVFTEISTSTKANSSVVARETRQSQSYDTWTIIVAVFLVLLVLAIVLVVVYFKVLRKSDNLMDKRRSVVKYSKKEEGDYVDMEIQSESVFGAKANPGIPVYDNYPSDDESVDTKTTAKQEAVNPIYETMTEDNDQRVEKSQDNVLYGASESNPGTNVYEELPNPRKKQNHVYESASIPAGNRQ